MSLKVLPLPFDVSKQVNCRKCVACCQNQVVAVQQEDAVAGRTYVVDDDDVIPNKKNGDCYYLDPQKGCTIYDGRPAVCRTFRCDHAVANMPDTAWTLGIRKAAKRIRRGLPGK